MRAIIKDMVCNNKGFSVVEIAIVLLLISVLALGFAWSGKQQLELAAYTEARALIQEIVSKQKAYASKNMGNYKSITARTDFAALDDTINIDARKNKYFKDFTTSSRVEQGKDGRGQTRDLNMLSVTVYGSGNISDVTRTATYNRFSDDLTIH